MNEPIEAFILVSEDGRENDVQISYKLSANGSFQYKLLGIDFTSFKFIVRYGVIGENIMFFMENDRLLGDNRNEIKIHFKVKQEDADFYKAIAKQAVIKDSNIRLEPSQAKETFEFLNEFLDEGEKKTYREFCNPSAGGRRRTKKRGSRKLKTKRKN